MPPLSYRNSGGVERRAQGIGTFSPVWCVCSAGSGTAFLCMFALMPTLYASTSAQHRPIAASRQRGAEQRGAAGVRNAASACEQVARARHHGAHASKYLPVMPSARVKLLCAGLVCAFQQQSRERAAICIQSAFRRRLACGEQQRARDELRRHRAASTITRLVDACRE